MSNVSQMDVSETEPAMSAIQMTGSVSGNPAQTKQRACAQQAPHLFLMLEL
jgi:hypothetical protein